MLQVIRQGEERVTSVLMSRPSFPSLAQARVAFLEGQRQAFTATPADAAKLLAVGLAPRPPLDPVEHAAWTQLARVILNTQEVITRY